MSIAPDYKLMLAGSADPNDLAKVKLPVRVSVKLDGVRAHVYAGRVWSRDHKLIPNRYVQQLYGRPEFEGMDGELIVGPPTAKNVFRITMAAVMSESHLDGSRAAFFIFDSLQVSSMPFTNRLLSVVARVAKLKKKRVPGLYEAVEHEIVESVGELLRLEEQALSAGYEGLMLRSVDGPYKHGRSTTREGYLLKLKRFRQCEARIVGFEEQERNENAKGADGKRTSHKAGKVGKNTLGALVVEGINGDFKGVRFNVGTGFSDEERDEIWGKREIYVDSLIRVKYFPTGSKDRPRFPTFDGFRDPRDL